MSDIEHLRNILKEISLKCDVDTSEADEFVDAIEEQFEDLESQVEDLEKEKEDLIDKLNEYENEALYDESFYLGLDTIYYRFGNGNIKIRSLFENAMRRIAQ